MPAWAGPKVKLRLDRTWDMGNGTRKPMRQGQQNRRGRGRGRKVQNPLTRNLESNGPDVKIRGTASHIAEKYAALARDALASGDTVAGESYLQHAEHYNRIIMANQAQQAENTNGSGQSQNRERNNGAGDLEEKSQQVATANDGGEISVDDGVARTIARTVKKSGNGADDSSNAADSDSEKKGDKSEAADEATT